MKIISNNQKLYYLYNRNTKQIQNKIIECLVKEPSLTDGEGMVYGFTNKNDINKKNDFYVKLGRTTRLNPAIRINEQGGKQIFTLKTIYNKKLERLIHLFFKFAHEIRMNENTKKKEIEWFHFTEKIDVVGFINEINILSKETPRKKNISTY